MRTLWCEITTASLSSHDKVRHDYFDSRLPKNCTLTSYAGRPAILVQWSTQVPCWWRWRGRRWGTARIVVAVSLSVPHQVFIAKGNRTTLEEHAFELAEKLIEIKSALFGKGEAS